MKTLLEAIAQMEGFYKHGSRPQRNNSPGDLVYGSEAIRFGATSGDPHYAVFPTPAVGWMALRSWLMIPAKFEDGKLVGGYRGATLGECIFRFAPPTENNSMSYLLEVCELTELKPDTIVTEDLLGFDMEDVK